MPLKIVIVGTGLDRLAAAILIKQESLNHNILVVESALELAEVSSISINIPLIQ